MLTNTFSTKRSSGDANIDHWTHEHFVSKIRSTIDYVAVTNLAPVVCHWKLYYDMNVLTDHVALEINISWPGFQAHYKDFRKNLVGWQPRNSEDLISFQDSIKTSIFEARTIHDVQQIISKAASSIQYSTKQSRKTENQHGKDETPESSNLRADVATCCSPTERRCLAKTLWRQHRAWQRRCAQERFIKDAMSMDRHPRTTNTHLPVLVGRGGVPQTDQVNWHDKIHDFYQALYSEAEGDLRSDTVLRKLETELSCQRQTGRH